MLFYFPFIRHDNSPPTHYYIIIIFFFPFRFLLFFFFLFEFVLFFFLLLLSYFLYILFLFCSSFWTRQFTALSGTNITTFVPPLSAFPSSPLQSAIPCYLWPPLCISTYTH
jgi:hypothetical protein